MRFPRQRCSAPLLIFSCLILSLFSKTLRAQIQDPGVPDTIRLECTYLETAPSIYDSIAVPVYIYNDDVVYGFSLGFHYDSELIEFSSWTEGPIMHAGGIHQTTLNEEGNEVLLGWVMFAPAWAISPDFGGSRLLATMYFRPLPGIDIAVIDFDSSFVPPFGKFAVAVQEAGDVRPQYADCGTAEIVVGSLTACNGPALCGDADLSTRLDISDAIHMINYIFTSGSAPMDISGGDINCSGFMNISDVVRFINYLFGGGSALCMDCYELPMIDSVRIWPEVVDPGRYASIDVFATEPTGGLLKYIYDADDWSQSGYSRRAYWRAPGAEGEYSMNLSVTDNCDTIGRQMTIPVMHVTPVIQSFSADRQLILPGNATNLHVLAIDPNGDPLTYQYFPSEGTVTGNDSVVTWNSPAYAGDFTRSYSIVATVSDGIRADTATIAMRTSSVPVIDAIEVPDTLFAGATVQVVAAAIDPVGLPLTYTYAVSSGSISQDGSNVAFWTLPNFVTFAGMTVYASNGAVTVHEAISVSIIARP